MWCHTSETSTGPWQRARDVALRRDRPRGRVLLLLAGVLGVLGSMSPARVAHAAAPATEPQPTVPAASDLDAQLEKELDAALGDALFEGLDDLPPAAEAMPGDDQPAADRDPLDEPDLDAATSGGDPLIRLGEQMRRVEQSLEQHRSGRGTQQAQQRIIDELDQLLRELRRQQQQASAQSSAQTRARRQQVGQPQNQPGGSGGESNQPARDSSERLGSAAAERPDREQLESWLKDLWGHLPEREREMMINATIERFVPKYELLIEEYFKRLIDQQQP